MDLKLFLDEKIKIADPYEAVREQAYYLWEAAGRPEGRSEEFWHEAMNIVYPKPDVWWGWDAMLSLKYEGKQKPSYPTTPEQREGVQKILNKYPWLKRKVSQ